MRCMTKHPLKFNFCQVGIIFLCVLLCTACGQKGALYLEKENLKKEKQPEQPLQHKENLSKASQNKVSLYKARLYKESTDSQSNT